MKSTLKKVSEQVRNNELLCNVIRADIDVCKQENLLLKRKIKALEEKSVRAEAYSRRENLIFDGIEESTSENVESKLKDIMRRLMKCENVDEMKFVRAHRLQNRKKIIVKFHLYSDRDHVWSNRKNLKGHKIWVEEDFPVEIRNKRQVLLPIFRAALKVPDTRASLVSDRLVINGQSYTVDSLHQLPSNLKLDQTSLVTFENTVFFFGRSSPLSNFFPAHFKEDGIEFSCSEQYYQWRKAEENGHHDAANDILLASDPAKMYKIGKDLPIDANKWTEGTRKKVMEKALIAKFQGNQHLRDVLQSTGDKDIVEASPSDGFWGAQVGMNNIRGMPKENYPGSNELGKLLQSVRNDLRI